MIPSDIEPRLHQLVTAFLAENAKLNLSAFRTEEQCWIGNVLDSIALLDIRDKLPPLQRLLDIGTGGGFPLLPLAVALPQTQCIGLDSVQKKIAAVERIVASVGIQNIRCIVGRAEEFGRLREYRETFDVVTLRAVAELATLLEYASAFVRVGGRIVVWKSLQMEQELEESLLARAELSCHLVDTYTYELPGNWGKRQLLQFEKTAPLSSKYPRPVGVPKKQPLK